VDAFALEVTYTTLPPECQDGAFQCQGDDLLFCEGWTWVLYESCEHGCADQACLPPPGEDTGPVEPDVVTPPPDVVTPPPEDAVPEIVSPDAVPETVFPWDAPPGPDQNVAPGTDADHDSEAVESVPGGCVPDSRRCNGFVVEVCVLDGSHWTYYRTCPEGQTCQDGDCVPSEGAGAPSGGCSTAKDGRGALSLLILLLLLAGARRFRRQRTGGTDVGCHQVPAG